jgi:hypothetical protein
MIISFEKEELVEIFVSGQVTTLKLGNNLSDVTFLKAFSAQSSNNREVLLKTADLLLELLCNTTRLRLLVFLKLSDKTNTCCTHTFMFLLNLIRVKGLKHSLLPNVLAGGPVSDQLPKLSEGVDLLLAQINLRVL